MDQERKNKQSTTPSSKDATLNDLDAADRPGERTHACYVTSVTDQSFTPTGRVYSDQTGRFAVPSANGNKYIMVVYDYDSNYVFLEAFRTRTAACLLAAYKNIHARLVSAGLRPQYQTLDSEISDAFKAFLRTVGVTYQLVPPGVHRRNAAERAIRTVQNHFIAGLCSTDPNFPIFLWDKLLPQAELTLNLLRGSRLNPKLSAWAQVNGVFDYQRTPIGPPGTRVLVHDKPDQRSTWSPHGLEAWYIGPALEYYRCFRCWVWDTRKERVCDTLRWHPARVRLPASSSTDTIILCLKDIAAALRHPAPRSPLAPLTDAQNKALRDIVTILNNNVGGSVTFDSTTRLPTLTLRPPTPYEVRGCLRPKRTPPRQRLMRSQGHADAAYVAVDANTFARPKVDAPVLSQPHQRKRVRRRAVASARPSPRNNLAPFVRLAPHRCPTIRHTLRCIACQRKRCLACPRNSGAYTAPPLTRTAATSLSIRSSASAATASYGRHRTPRKSSG